MPSTSLLKASLLSKATLSKIRFLRAAAVTSIFFIICLSFTLLQSRHVSALGSSHVGGPTPSEAGYLHLLIPASHTDQNLCKTMLSAEILGYPAPVLINWQKHFDDPALVEGGSHLGKISGIHTYLQDLQSARDSDLVLMVDAYDIWFQLRPQTLIDRYLDQNRRANERIRHEIGTEVVDKHNISQQIIFSCQKRCWPWSENDPPCYAVPESSLPIDVYGPQTDTDIGDQENPYIKYRQRFLNSGVAIGTVGAMRKLYKEAMTRAVKDPNFGSDQNIFSGLFGEQEVLRELRRQQSMGTAKWMVDGMFGAGGRRSFKKEHLALVEDRDVEFGLGVDYESSIGLATVFAEDDTEWIIPNDKTQLTDANNSRDIPAGETRIGDLPEDVARTLPPFWTFGRTDLPRETTWSEISLLTNIWTGVTPTIIHHNAHRDGLKSRRESWWNQIWFQKHARELYNAHITHPLGPIAVSMGKQWWSLNDWKGGARYDGDDWARYEDICTGTEDEVFRDDLGPWILPNDH